MLSGTANDTNFRGFLVQGRTMADNSPIGTFTNNGGDQQLVCEENVSI